MFVHYVSDLEGRPDALREVRDGFCSDDIRKLRGAKDIGDGIDTVLAEARTRIPAWKADCNGIGPHSSLGNRAPEECAVRAGPAMKAA